MELQESKKSKVKRFIKETIRVLRITKKPNKQEFTGVAVAAQDFVHAVIVEINGPEQGVLAEDRGIGRRLREPAVRCGLPPAACKRVAHADLGAGHCITDVGDTVAVPVHHRGLGEIAVT